MGEAIRFRARHSSCHGTTALGPHAIFVKVIYTLGSRIKCSGHPGRVLRKVLRTVSASPLMLDMTVMSTSGVNVLPLATVVSIMDAVSTGTPFVVPPVPGIERPVMQAQDFSTCRLPRSREFLSLFRLSASSPAPTLPRDSAKDSSPSLSLDVFSLYEGTHRLRLERPCCSRQQMTVWLRVWVIQTLLRGVNSIQDQNPLGLVRMCDCPGSTVDRTLRCFRLGWL